MPLYDEKCIKAKVREFNGVVNTNFWGDKVKKRHASHLYSPYKYWFCYGNGKKELYTDLFRRT